MRLVVCFLLVLVNYAVGRNNSYITTGLVLNLPDCSYHGFFDHSIHLPRYKKTCDFTCYCLDSKNARCKEYEPIVCGNKVGTRNELKKKGIKRVKRAFGLGEIFFRDAVKETLNKQIETQCKPYESSYSEGCPPEDWCVGCTVCDCDANGFWDCHNLSFCPDGKNGTEALKKTIKWQDYAKRPPKETKKKIKKPKRPSKTSPNSKSRRRKTRTTTKRPVTRQRPISRTTPKITNKTVKKRETKLVKKEIKNKMTFENKTKTKKVPTKKFKNIQTKTTKVHTSMKRPTKKLTTVKATTKPPKKLTTVKAVKKKTTTKSPRMKLIESLITEEEKSSKNFTRELAQKIARRYIESIQKVIMRNNDKLFEKLVKQKINQAKVQNPKNNKATTSKQKDQTIPMFLRNEYVNDLYDRKKRYVEDNDKQEKNEPEFYDVDAKHMNLEPVLNKNDQKYYKYLVQPESNNLNTIFGVQTRYLDQTTVTMKPDIEIKTLIKNKSDQNVVSTTVASSVLTVLDQNYSNTSDLPIMDNHLKLRRNNSHMKNNSLLIKILGYGRYDIPVNTKMKHNLNGTKIFCGQHIAIQNQTMEENIQNPSTATNDIVLPKYSFPSRRPYYNPTRYAKMLIGNIIKNDTNYLRSNENMSISSIKLIKDVCKLFGPCKVNKMKKKLLKSKLNTLNNETKQIFQILKTIKGLLKLLNEKTTKQLNMTLGKEGDYIKGIHKLYYINTSEANLTQSEEIILKDLKDYMYRFITSFKNFVTTLDSIFKTLISHNKFNSFEKHDCNGKRNRHRLDRKFSTLTEPEARDPVIGLTNLLLKYNIFQNSFMQNIYKTLLKLQMQINDSQRMREKLLNEEKEEIFANRNKIMERYSRRIKESIQKINDIAEKINSTSTKRVKRSLYYEGDLTVEYLLFLLEYLLKRNNHGISKRPTDGIDDLIDAIERAPKIKPIKNELYEETKTSDEKDLFVVTAAPNTISSRNNERFINTPRKSIAKGKIPIQAKEMDDETLEFTHDDENIYSQRYTKKQTTLETNHNPPITNEMSYEVVVPRKGNLFKPKEKNTPSESNSFEQPIRITEYTANKNNDRNVLLNEELHPMDDDKINSYTKKKTSLYKKPSYIAQDTKFKNTPTKTSPYEVSSQTADDTMLLHSPAKLTTDNVESSGTEKNNESEDSYVTSNGKVLRTDINDDLLAFVDYNVTNDINNIDSAERKKDQDLINSFYKTKQWDSGIDNEDAYEKIEEDKGNGGGIPQLFVTRTTTIPPIPPKKPIVKDITIDFFDDHGVSDTGFITTPKTEQPEPNFKSSEILDEKHKGETKTKVKRPKASTTTPPIKPVPPRRTTVTINQHSPTKQNVQKKWFKSDEYIRPQLVWVDESSEEDKYTKPYTIMQKLTTTTTEAAPTERNAGSRIADLSDLSAMSKVMGSRINKKDDKDPDVILKHKTQNFLSSLEYDERIPVKQEISANNRDDSESSEEKREDFSAEY